MDFAQAWETLSIGDQVAVSNGKPPPSANTEGVPYKAWRSHNFTGELVEKIDGPFRAMRFDLPVDEAGTIIGFTVLEAIAHSYELA
jgi:hypothetical protein